MQENWIGKSQGLQFRFALAEPVDGMTRRGLHHAARHDLRRELRRGRARSSARAGARRAAIAAAAAFIAECKQRRHHRGRARDGGEAGLRHRPRGRSIRSIPTWRLPVYIANFVLMDYGTGAIFGVPGARPARFRFRDANTACRSCASSPRRPTMPAQPIEGEAETGDGVLVNSRFLDGMSVEAAKAAVIAPRRGRRLGRGHDRLAAARLGRLAPALLGHADPDHPLRGVRRGAGAEGPAAGHAARGRRLRHPRQSARAPSDLEACRLPAMRRRGASARPTRSTPSSIPRWYFIRFASQPADQPFDQGESPSAGCRSTSISAGSSMRSCTCSTPASGRARCSRSAMIDVAEPFSRPVHPGHGDARDLSRAGDGALAQRPTRSSSATATLVETATGEPVDDRPRREDVQVEDATRSIPSRSSTSTAPTRCAGSCSPTARPSATCEWTESGHRGRLALRPAAVAAARSQTRGRRARTRRSTRKLHQTIAAVGADIEALAFNKAVAQDLRADQRDREGRALGRPQRRRSATLVLLVAPMVPHLAEEAWAAAGNAGLVADARLARGRSGAAGRGRGDDRGPGQRQAARHADRAQGRAAARRSRRWRSPSREGAARSSTARRRAR